MALAENVKYRRIKLGMTQEELATKMGYKSRSSINKIEGGRNCSQRVIADLAIALNCSPAELLMGFEELNTIERQQADMLDAIESYELIRTGLSRYFDEKFTDKEIGKLIRYAKLLIEDRDG